MSENNIRAFIAIEINGQAKEKILEIITYLNKSSADVKWVTENQIHITLKFLGNIGTDKIQEISNTLSIISENFKPFTITFSKIGAFPSLNHPRAIWLGIDKNVEILCDLNRRIENDLEKIGFTKESQEFKPHIALGRVRSAKNISGLISLIEKQPLIQFTDIQINSLTLFQSSLTSKGAIYSRLSTH